MSIILLRGFSHSGKDHVGRILSNEYGYQRFAFADSLKKMVAKNFGCPLDKLHSQSGKMEICNSDILLRTYRQILIDEAFRLRNQDAGIFANLCCQEIKTLGSKNVVITDWRYPNEIEVIRNMFPTYKITPVHIVRDGHEKISPVDDISEYHLIDRDGDFVLYNHMDNTIHEGIRVLMSQIHPTHNHNALM
jgi:hypothetical protein